MLTGVKNTVIPEAQKKIYDTIGAKALGYDLGDRMSYILKAIGVESAFSPTAKNPNSSAFGLGQMLKTTAEKYGFNSTLDSDGFNITQSKFVFYFCLNQIHLILLGLCH